MKTQSFALLSTLVGCCMAESRFAGYGFSNYECTGSGSSIIAFDGKVSSAGLGGAVAVKAAARGSMYTDPNCNGQGYVANKDDCSYIDTSSTIGCLKVYF